MLSRKIGSRHRGKTANSASARGLSAADLQEQLDHRTHEASEALEQQTATAEVLRVISVSAGDLDRVFEAMLANAKRICEANFGNVLLYDGTGFHASALPEAPAAFVEMYQRGPIRPGPMSVLGRLISRNQVVHILDTMADEVNVERDPFHTAATDLLGARTLLAVPMLKGNQLLGAIVIYRKEVRPFTEKQIWILTSFAAQAVIAIEHTRLLDDVQKRTAELTETLENLRTAQDRLVQTEKLASLGQLTAGIAHEIKNPLNFINNFSVVSIELIKELREAIGSAQLDGKLSTEIAEISEMLHGNLQKVVQHDKRADSIIKNMLLHSRQDSGEHRLVDINAIVEESLICLNRGRICSISSAHFRPYMWQSK